jgi:hypothetical protein
MSWARLLKRVFEIDMEHCSQCGGTLKIIAAIEHPPVITKILTHPVCPPEHRPEQRPGPSIDPNWPDPPPNPAPVRFSPCADPPCWPSLARDAKTLRNIAPWAEEGPENAPIPGRGPRMLDSSRARHYSTSWRKKGV